LIAESGETDTTQRCSESSQHPLARINELTTAAQKKTIKTPIIMVVDDSLTVRKVTCRLLEREG